MVIRELLHEIKETYGRDIFTLAELYEILLRCDYSHAEARKMVREMLNDKQLCRVSRRKIKRNLPRRSSYVAIIL